MLVDLVDLPVDFSVDFSVHVSVDCLPMGIRLVGRTLLHRNGYLPLFDFRCSFDDLDSNWLLIAILAR